MAIPGFHLLKPYKKCLGLFDDYFEQIEPEPEVIKKTFELSAFDPRITTFFQSKKTYKWVDGNIPLANINNDFLNALEYFYDPKIYNGDHDFNLSTPFRKSLQIPMSQPMAIYIIIFYLGSLVRYYPSYLEKILNSEDAWLIERFAKSSPQTFLRYIANAILKTNRIYTQR